VTGKILVVGGAGYIGSHCAKELARKGYGVVTLDDLSRGHRHAVRWGEFEQGDMGDRSFVGQVFRRHEISAVMQFGGLIAVGESVTDPESYYRTNVAATLVLLGAMREHSVKRFIFSSTAATYGEPRETPIPESHPLEPINPYGRSKLMVERILADFESAYGFSCTSFRYFNAAGADPDGEIGEEHDPETHLIPLVLRAVLGGPPLKLFGTDYPTRDGTNVRDYIHVTDLAAAHILGLERLLAGSAGSVYNLGNGSGFGNLEVIRAAEEATGRKVPYQVAARRPGDPATLVGSSEKAVRELGWKPQFARIEQIMETAWRWHSRRPAGAIHV
jgi:UDP-glucose-4-epimerase GalE